MEEPHGEVVPQETRDEDVVGLKEFKSTLHYFAGQPVGYLDLSSVNHELDVEKILKKGLDTYPSLCILHYRNTKGQVALEIRSAKFQLNQTRVELTQRNPHETCQNICQLFNQLSGQVRAATAG